jgi:hypothetical protein
MRNSSHDGVFTLSSDDTQESKEESRAIGRKLKGVVEGPRVETPENAGSEESEENLDDPIEEEDSEDAEVIEGEIQDDADE